ncbi:DUF5689 domain-containing protein [Flavobacterium rhizosphaerae]|uniref:DUF5689 domain-containing protein n=1 Tax=Flavobacterium rhizosphaerae TaxID=3163298 RepID=A0ABW8YUZ4_9FLAO
MKSKFLKAAALTVVFSAVFSGCANNDDYGTVVVECENPGLIANKTPAQLFAMAGTAPVMYTNQVVNQEDIIEAYVNSSDERGNFFKTVYMQTLPTEGQAPIGFSVAIDDNSLFGEGFYPGNKVYIKLDSLYYAKVNSSLAIGALYNGSIGRISQFDYKEHLVPSCSEKVSEEQLVRTMSITQALNNANLNTLIELENVQFEYQYLGGTYFDEDDDENTAGGATNRRLIDELGNSIIFRTSSYANFSGDVIPANSGRVRGVLTKYGSDFQFMARSEEDIKLDQERFGSLSPTAKGGADITFSGSFTEDFESYAVDQQAFPKYINDYLVGGRYWELTTFSSNKYIEMTSYAGSSNPNGVTARTFFFVPVNFGDASSFTFDKEIRYMAGECLKVYYVTEENYEAGDVFNVDTFVDITSEFNNLNYPTTPGTSQNSFTTAGTYAIPAGLTGNGFFVFEYHGGNGVTTTIQIDNITVN